jgi:pimeloyl-ACP methyl ester carboxylesterase
MPDGWGSAMGEWRAESGKSDGPFQLQAQGSFYVGGRTIEAPGTFDPRDGGASLRDPAGQSYRVDQLYARYQIPPNPRRLPMVFVHGSTQHGKTYESTPDGREGFETIFVRRGFSTYVVDFPRRGRAGYPSFTGKLGELAGSYPVIPDRTYRTGDKWSFTIWRLGIWPDLYPGSRFPQDPASLSQVFDQIGPDMTDDPVVIADAIAALFDKIGPAILVTHSQSGLFGWMAAIRSANVKAVIAFEPGGFVFPGDDMPPEPPVRLGLFLPGRPVTPAEFARLARIPIRIVYGDHIPKTPSGVPSEDFWQAIAYGPAGALPFTERVNALGGQASFVALPDIGIRGNTHFVISDTNNVEIADLLSAYLSEHGLDR